MSCITITAVIKTRSRTIKQRREVQVSGYIRGRVSKFGVSKELKGEVITEFLVGYVEEIFVSDATDRTKL